MGSCMGLVLGIVLSLRLQHISRVYTDLFPGYCFESMKAYLSMFQGTARRGFPHSVNLSLLALKRAKPALKR